MKTIRTVYSREADLQLLVDQTPAAIAMFDREMRYLAASRRWVEDYHLEGQELIGRSHYDVFPDLPEKWKEIHRRCLAGAIERRDEDTFHRADGTVEYIRWEVRPWRDARGEIGGLIILAEVISDWKRAREAERHRSAELEALMQAIPAAVWIAHDSECARITGNPAAYELLGFSPRQDFHGGGYKVFQDGKELSWEERPLQRAAREGVTLSGVELDLVFPDGMRRSVYGSASPLLNEEGAPRGAVAVFVDITSLRSREAELELLALTGELLNHSTDAEKTVAGVPKLVVPGLADWCILDLTAPGGRMRRAGFLHRDPEMQRRAAASLPEFIEDGERGPSKVVRSAAPRLYESLEDDASLQEVGCDAPHRRLLRDMGAASAMIVPLPARGTVLGALVLVRDRARPPFGPEDARAAKAVAERAALAIDNARLFRDVELRVRERTAELEAANRELDAFSSSVSHDLRAPLRSLSGFSQALLKHHREALSDEGRHYLDRISAAASRMGHLIEDLLGLSRAARAEVRRENLDLARLARSVVADLAERDPKRQVTFVAPESLRVQADPKLARILLENVLGNAWKFSRNKTAATIELGGKDGTFFVRDDGAGFDMTYSDQLFHPFQRLHSEREFEGTGIGLATVMRIVRKHGGRIWAEGEVGKGATFYFSLGGES